MNKEIDKLVSRLRVEYVLFWILITLQVVFYETGILNEGILVGDSQMEYVMQLLGVLMIIVLIPLSLKIFSVAQNKIIKHKSLEEAIKSYLRWSEVRLFMLLSAALFNITVYYSILDKAGLFCAAMAILASLFCIPEKDRVYHDLQMVSEEEQ